MDSFEICRVCVEEVNYYWFLFESCDTVPSGFTPAHIIAECTSVEIDRDDGLPELVCNSCLQALVSAYQIREKCISSDRKLRKLLLQNKSSIAQRAIEQPDQANQTKNDSISNEIETSPQTVLSMDENEAYESADKECSNDNCHTEPDHADSSVVELELLESVSYSEEYLMSIKQEQYGDNDDGDDGEEQSIAVDEDHENDHDLSVDRMIDMEVQILKSDHSEVSAEVESAANSQNYTQSDTSEDKTGIVCVICEKRFSTKGNLKAHILLHNNYKPFRCELCGDEFSRKHNYNVHKMRHTGKRIHQCPECDKSFVCTVNLKHHMIIHSNVKPFKCNRCGKEFSYRIDLARHEAYHTGIFPFSCEVCQRKFSRKSSLTKHLPKCKGQKKKRTSKEQTGVKMSDNE